MQIVVNTTITPVERTATTTTETLNFTYDASGTPLSVKFSGTDYYYVTNIQGDIMAILNTSGSAVVSYTYDAWGKLYSTTGTLADTLGKANPLTYRGFVYDQETSLYYLQSRYYDPGVGRFINADGLVATGQGLLGNNMFAYCLNNPVNRTDMSGTSGIWYYLMVDSEWGFVHRMVQEHINATHGQSLLIEIGVKGRGRADIVAPGIGAVWEIKHQGSMYEARCAEAKAQASKYLYGTCTDGTIISTYGNAGAFSGTFCIYVNGVNYEVNYTTPQDGVVLYTVHETQNKKEAYAYAYEYVPHKERNNNKAPVIVGGVMYSVTYTSPIGGCMCDPRLKFIYN